MLSYSIDLLPWALGLPEWTVAVLQVTCRRRRSISAILQVACDHRWSMPAALQVPCRYPVGRVLQQVDVLGSPGVMSE